MIRISSTKRMFSFIMSVFMVISLLPSISLKAYGGKLYKINSYNGLKLFAEKVNNGETTLDACLECDIILEENESGLIEIENWIPIGKDEEHKYSGTFDGGGKTIKELCTTDVKEVGGLFGYIGESGQVKNVSVEDSKIKGTYYVGGVCGRNDGEIINCNNLGEVSGSGYVGGVCGLNNGKIINCNNCGEVSDLVLNIVKRGAGFVGGVCGHNGGIMMECHNEMNIDGLAEIMGGVCGNNNGLIEKCYNEGEVNASCAFIGGVCGGNVGGNLVGNLVNCYNTGSVKGNSINDEKHDSCVVGGVCGSSECEAERADAAIQNCYNTGNVSGDNSVGGVCGKTDTEKRKIENCYYNEETCGEKIVAIGEASSVSSTVKGLTTKEMTGTGAAKTMFGESNVWCVKENDHKNDTGEDQYAYYPHFSEVDSKDWPPKIKIYYVTFDANVGTKDILGSDGDQIFYDGIYQKLNPCSYSNAGYVFDGWFDRDNNSAKYKDEEECKFTKNITLCANWRDEEAPTGELFIDKDKLIAEGKPRYYNSTVTINIDVNDSGSGVASVYYHVDDKTADLEIEPESWKECSNYAVELNNDGKYRVYVKITDKSGNSCIINSGIIVIDTVAPTNTVKISNGKDAVVTWKCDEENSFYFRDSIQVQVVADTSDEVEVEYCCVEKDKATSYDKVWAEGQEFEANCWDKWTLGVHYVLCIKLEDKAKNKNYIIGTVAKFSDAEVEKKYLSIIKNCGDAEVRVNLNGCTISGIKCNERDVSYSTSTDDDNITEIKIKENFIKDLNEGEHKLTILYEKYGESGPEPSNITLIVKDYFDIYNTETGKTLEDFAREAKTHPAISGKLMEDVVLNSDGFYLNEENKLLYGGIQVDSGNSPKEWEPIGDESSQYAGTFDGGGHTITGMYVNISTEDYIGLFGYIGAKGVVQNVGIENGYIEGKDFVGSICGINGGTIQNCYNTGFIKGTNNIGGMCGQNNGKITNCYNTRAITGTDNIGGVCGRNEGTITTCYNTGTVTAAGSSVGGVCGQNYRGTIENCYYNTEICQEKEAVGDGSTGNSTNVTGLTTTQMTGIENSSADDGSKRAKQMMSKFEEKGWYFAEDNLNYMFYPHLKEFESIEKWPPKVRLNIVKIYADDIIDIKSYLNKIGDWSDFGEKISSATGIFIEIYGDRVSLSQDFFKECKSLTHLTIVGNVTVEEGALASISGLNTITIGKDGETSTITLVNGAIDEEKKSKIVYEIRGTISSEFNLNNNCVVAYGPSDLAAKVKTSDGSDYHYIGSSSNDIFEKTEIESGSYLLQDEKKWLIQLINVITTGKVLKLNESDLNIQQPENSLKGKFPKNAGLVIINESDLTHITDWPVIKNRKEQTIFVTISLQDSITMNFYVPETYKDVTLTSPEGAKVIDDSSTKTFEDVVCKKYTYRINSDKMDEYVTIEWLNENNQKEQITYSIAAYVFDVIEHSSFSENFKNLARAAYLYGCAVRYCFEKNSSGSFDYIVSKIKEYVKSYTFDGLSVEQIEKYGSVWKDINVTLLLSDRITQRFSFKLNYSKESFAFEVSFGEEGENGVKTADVTDRIQESEDGYYLDVIGFSPARLDLKIQLSALDPTDSSIKDKILFSPLDYMTMEYHTAKKKGDEDLALLMQAMYYYYDSAKKYKTIEGVM